jgi:phosphocarrier protein HPr
VLEGPTKSCVLTILNTRGLHARASAKFVKCAGAFDAEVLVSKDGLEVDGRSIMGLLMLGASIGTKIEISATGPQANEVLAALSDIVDSKFDEDQPG